MGAMRIGGDAIAGPDTVFEIGSVTKVFTGLLLADRVVAGKARLEDAVSSYVPNGQIPSFRGKSITLAHLASHGSGLPAMPDNLVGDEANPASGYTKSLLWDFLSRTTLPRPPGQAYRYSNVGIGLLGIALSEGDGGATYDAMLAARITGPLEMRDTRIDRAGFPEARLAQGYRKTTPMPPNRIDTLEAAGALRSTAGDMVKFVRALVDRGHPLDAAVDLVETPVLDKAANESCGLALEIRREAAITYFEKVGATSGFGAQIVLSRTPPVGVVVLANSGGADVTGIARSVHDAVARTAIAAP